MITELVQQVSAKRCERLDDLIVIAFERLKKSPYTLIVWFTSSLNHKKMEKIGNSLLPVVYLRFSLYSIVPGGHVLFPLHGLVIGQLVVGKKSKNGQAEFSQKSMVIIMKNLKEDTKKDYARRMDLVLDYIQGHMDEDLSLAVLADVACFSAYHFHRVFSGMVGESVKSYVRRIRLERAAGKLKHSDEAVTLIAYDAGFETHESFTRAFHKMFGVSPLGFRKVSQVELAIRKIQYWKEIEMKVEIVEMKEMDVIFVRHIGPYGECGKAWDSLCQWAAPQGLLQPGVKILGLSYDDPEVTPADKLRYDACIEIDGPIDVEQPIGHKQVKGGRYAMATHFGPYDHLAETYAMLCGQWVPQNGYDFDDRPCIEIYQNSPEDTEPLELITDIYIPLK